MNRMATSARNGMPPGTDESGDPVSWCNRSIACMNDADTAGAEAAAAATVAALEADPAVLPRMLEVYQALRGILVHLRNTDLLLRLDALFDPMLGDGVAQFDDDRDVDLRRTANAIIEQVNAGDAAGAREALRFWARRYVDAARVAPADRDVLNAMRETAARLDLGDVASDIAGMLTLIDVFEIRLKSYGDDDFIAKSAYIDFPSRVSIETFAKCNARCTFCPYPDLEKLSDRAGERMPDELFEKIIDDLTDIPRAMRPRLNFSRLNEPFLDARLFDFMDLAGEKLPESKIALPTNGSCLNAKNLERLNRVRTMALLNISLNSHDKAEYEETMGLPYERTIAIVDSIHDMAAAGELNFMVNLTTVRSGGPGAQAFAAWCRKRYPLFTSRRYEPTDWLGLRMEAVNQRRTFPLPCNNWFKLHILSDGSEALCCFDGLGRFAGGNVRDSHALEVYNAPAMRTLRRKLPPRQSAEAPEICRGCSIN